MPNIVINGAKCLGCEQCSVACARINELGEDRKDWNIRMVNGIAKIMDLSLCRGHQGCMQICLQQCPTKAIAAQVSKI